MINNAVIQVFRWMAENLKAPDVFILYIHSPLNSFPVQAATTYFPWKQKEVPLCHTVSHDTSDLF